MKRSPSSQILNSKLNLLKSRNWKMKTALKLLMLFSVLLSFENSIAQSINSISIKEADSYLSLLKTSSPSDYEKLNNLIYESNSTVYIKNNTLKVFGEKSTVLNLDAASFNFIKNNSIPSNYIEIVRINIKKSADINQKIDLSVFSEFPNLKYIYIVSNMNITKQNVSNMILNNDEKYTILYKINQAE